MPPVPELGKVQHVDPRKAWKSEPQDFTPWLQENIGLLGEAIGLEIDPDVQREVPVGGFSADLVATDVATDRRILIENQLGPTDHSHLGQILTYASGLDAGILIWICTKVREEHAHALTWLNEHTGEDILAFAVEIGLLQIDGSAPAPLFNVIVAPNEWQKSVASSKPVSEGKAPGLYRAFWRGFITELKARDPHATTTDPQHAPGQNWFAIGLGRTGFTSAFVFGWQPDTGYRLRSEIYIDTPDRELNEHFFDELLKQHAEIEGELGYTLEWTKRPDIRACRIFAAEPGTINDAPANLNQYRELGVTRMLDLRRVFGPRVAQLTAQK